MRKEYVVVKDIGLNTVKEFYLGQNYRWYSPVVKPKNGLLWGNNPRALAKVLAAEHFKRKVLKPGSEPLITKDTYIKGPKGGYYHPITGRPVNLVPF